MQLLFVSKIILSATDDVFFILFYVSSEYTCSFHWVSLDFVRNIFVLSPINQFFDLCILNSLYRIFIPYSISLITACTIQPNVVSCCFLLVLSYNPSGDFPSYKMYGHAARQVRAVVTCRRYQYGIKGPLVRSLGDTWASIVISPRQQRCG